MWFSAQHLNGFREDCFHLLRQICASTGLQCITVLVVDVDVVDYKRKT